MADLVAIAEKEGRENTSESSQSSSLGLFLKEIPSGLRDLLWWTLAFAIIGLFVCAHPVLVKWLYMGGDLNKTIMISFVPAVLCYLVGSSALKVSSALQPSRTKEDFEGIAVLTFLPVFAYFYHVEWVVLFTNYGFYEGLKNHAFENLTNLQAYSLICLAVASLLPYLSTLVILADRRISIEATFDTTSPKGS